MSADELRSHITAVPFETFSLRTADGRRIPVRNRDFILITPNKRHVYVFQPDNSREVLDIMLILGLEFGPPPTDANGGVSSFQNPGSEA
jgi:hypothetical protein